MRFEADGATQPWVLQLCHGYDGPFLDCARQYAALFVGTPYKVCTVYLTGSPSDDVTRGSASDEVIFLDYDGKDIRGLKLDAIRRLRQIAHGRDFKFCIAHRFKPIYISLLATCLPVYGVHHAFGVYKRPMRRWFINRFRPRLLLLGVSNAVRDEIRAHLPHWDPARIETLYNRIDVVAVQSEQLSRDAAREYLGLPQEAWIVGNVGRLHPDKDQATLIRGFAEALPQLPENSLLVIMGEGRLRTALETLIQKLDVSKQVYLLGQVPHGRKYFKAFDVFALTSDSEPFGMVLLEAMAAKVPLICSDCGGGREVLDGSGWLFPFADKNALAECLIQAWERPELGGHSGLERLDAKFSDYAARQKFSLLSEAFFER